MDYLDKLTQLAQVRGEINIRCLFQGDWQVEHQPDVAEYQGLFHLIEQGECWVTLAGKQFHLKKGDLFFLPQNRPHFLGSSQQKRENSLQRAQSDALFNVHQIGAGTPDLKMFCGTFYYQIICIFRYKIPLCSLWFHFFYKKPRNQSKAQNR